MRYEDSLKDRLYYMNPRAGNMLVNFGEDSMN